MIITKEQQEAWVQNYAKEKHTNNECLAFIAGVEKVMGNLVSGNMLRLTSTDVDILIAALDGAAKNMDDLRVLTILLKYKLSLLPTIELGITR